MIKFEYTAQELFTKLQNDGENQRLEVKEASQIGSSIMQTICAFANTVDLNGGYLLLGVSEPNEVHGNFWVKGVDNTDKLLNDLQTNCRDQFERPISIQTKIETLFDKKVIVVYVPELESSSKPCIFKGNIDKKNKRKTGIWLRGSNGDYEATQEELEPIILAKKGKKFETSFLDSCDWSDLDLNAIYRYRQLRSAVRPDATELQYDDQQMLFALNLVNREYTPNIAGLLLFGKELSLRRLIPSIRVDYVRVQGNEWQQENFIETLDLREPLIYIIPKLESKILSDMPRHFRLEPNKLQRSDTPLLPQKVIRETIVNAVMHRDYFENQPILVVRYDDRLEVKNSGYSLKPVNELGKPGSRLRNPILASILYDLHFAETKGSGISVIRNQLKLAMLEEPDFKSDTVANSFSVVYPFHGLLNQTQFTWFRNLSKYSLERDEVLALVLAKENKTVTNTSLREVSNISTDDARKVLSGLIRKGLLLQQGTGRATYYLLSELAESKIPLELNGESSELNGKSSELNGESSELNGESSELNGESSELNGESSELNGESSELNGESLEPNDELVAILKGLIRKRVEPAFLQRVIVTLCESNPMSISKLSTLVQRSPATLRPLLRKQIERGNLQYLHSDNLTHPAQAYVITEQGKHWLKNTT